MCHLYPFMQNMQKKRDILHTCKIHKLDYICLFQRHPVWEDLRQICGGLHCPGDIPGVPGALHPLWQALLHPPQRHEGPSGALPGQEHAGGGWVLYSPPGGHQSGYTPGKLKIYSIFNHGFCRWESCKWGWKFCSLIMIDIETLILYVD